MTRPTGNESRNNEPASGDPPGDSVSASQPVFESRCDATTEATDHLSVTLGWRLDGPFAADPAIGATIQTSSGAQNPIEQSVLVSKRTVQLQDSTTDTLPEYTLLETLGRGGMGVVYQAHQASIDRSVAVKMMSPAIAEDGDLCRKFLEEAVVTGDLDHPNIVPIYDLGRSEDGALFYAMKEVRGRPWSHELQARSTAENIRILLGVSDAVAFAHSRGVIHRDLKPDNVMLGEFGEILLMDWGLALALSRHNESNSQLGGTPKYMAPEMATGPVAAIGPHSDIYLLGAILYEILTGSAPHHGSNVATCLLAAARNEIVSTQQRGELIDIALRGMATQPEDRFRSVHEFQESLRAYESHTESLTLADRAQRALDSAASSADYDLYAHALFGFQNALDLWDGNSKAKAGLTRTRVAYAEAALKTGDFDLGISILASEVTDQSELRGRITRAITERDARKQRLQRVRRTAASLAVGLVLVMSVAFLWVLKAENAAKFERDVARAQQQRAEQNFQLARQAVEQMLTEVGEHDLKDVPHMEAVRRSLLQKALSFYVQFLSDQPDDPSLREDAAKAYLRVGDISVMLGRHDEAEAAFLKSIGLFNRLVNEFPDRQAHVLLQARAHNVLGELYRMQGRSESAETQYQKAQTRQQMLVDESPNSPEYHQELARTAYNSGLLYWSTSRPEVARTAYNLAINELTLLCDGTGTQQAAYRQELARAHLNRGILNRGSGDKAAARVDYDRAISLLTELRGKFKRNAEYRYELATVFVNLGNLLLSDESERIEAKRVYGEGAGLLESLTEDFPFVILYRKELTNSMNSQAALEYFSGDFERARELWERARDTARRLVSDHPQVPENHSLLGRTLGNLGTLLIEQKQFDEARDSLLEAIRQQQMALDANPDHPGFRRFLRDHTWGLSKSYLGLSNHRLAAESAEQLPGILPDDPVESYRAASLTSRCAALAEEAGDWQQSMTYLNQAVAFLQAAIQNGFNDAKQVDEDPHFDSIRRSKAFGILRRKLD